MTDEELKGLFETMQRETRGELALMRTDVASGFSSMRQEMHAQHIETRRLFEETIEHMNTRFDLVAEGLLNLDEKFDRRCDGLEEKIDRGLTETQAIIKFAFGRRLK